MLCRAGLVKNRCFGETLRPHHRGCIIFLRSLLLLLVIANGPSSPILVTLMMEALRSSEMSVLTRVTWRDIPADDIFHSHCRENLKYYIVQYS
jgi:hypothetical protein